MVAGPLRNPIAPDGAPKIYQAGFGKMSYQPRQAVGFKGANDTANGINTGSSSNYHVNANDGYVVATPAVGSQISQATGTNIGTLTANGGLAAAFDGSTNQVTSACALKASPGTLSYIGKNYSASAQVISQAKVYGSSDTGYSGSGVTTTFNLRGSQTSPANSADGILLGSVGPIEDVQATNSQTIASNDTSTAWNYVWIELVISGASAAVMAEVEFYGPGAPQDMTLVTASQTTDASVSNARVLLEYDDAATPTINTDLTVEVTCDGGSNWATAMLAAVTAYSQGGRKVVETDLTSCVAGTSVAARIKTLNNKSVPIYALALQWE